MDPISDMLNRIKTSQRAGRREIVVSFSKVKMAILGILEKEGFIGSVRREKEGNFENIKATLKYSDSDEIRKIPAIQEIRRVSKAGQRIYVKKGAIKPVKNNFGISIVSTSKGIMTGKEAKVSGLGGEVICEVW